MYDNNSFLFHSTLLLHFILLFLFLIKKIIIPISHVSILVYQDTATCFVGRLSEEYAEYVDVVQPVQVAVYEMKLGSSLVLASVFQKDLLRRVELDDMDLIMVFFPFYFRFIFSFGCFKHMG